MQEGKFEAPVATTSIMRNRPPRISQNGVVAHIQHEEYFADVISASTAFQTFTYPVQPGVNTIFPWLSSIAQKYESYRFNKLSFVYKTSAATSAVGTVMMAVDYDPLDDAPSSKADLLTYKDAGRSAPWKQFDVSCSSADLNKLPQRFTRVGEIPAVSDLKTYDVGNLQVCLQGVAAATVGELYVCYDIVLMTPQTAKSIGGVVTVVGESTTAYFGTGFTATGPMPFEWTSGTTITFTQNFEGIFAWEIVGTVISADLAGGGTATSASMAQQVNAAGTGLNAAMKVKALAGQTLVPTMTETTITAVIFRVAPVPYAQL